MEGWRTREEARRSGEAARIEAGLRSRGGRKDAQAAARYLERATPGEVARVAQWLGLSMREVAHAVRSTGGRASRTIVGWVNEAARDRKGRAQG